MPQSWSSESNKKLETGCPGLKVQHSPSRIRHLWKTSTLQDGLPALVTGQEPVYTRLQHGNNNLRLLEMKGFWFGWFWGFVVSSFSKLCDISCKENSGTPSCISPGKLSWEFVVAYAPAVSGVLILKSCAVIAKTVKHKIQIPYLRISFHSSVFPLSPKPFLTCIATVPLHSCFFWGFLEEFCLFPQKAAYHFPRSLPNALHRFCYLSLLC